MSKKFGELVKEYRGKRTLKELGDEIGITSAYLFSYHWPFCNN